MTRIKLGERMTASPAQVGSVASAGRAAGSRRNALRVERILVMLGIALLGIGLIGDIVGAALESTELIWSGAVLAAIALGLLAVIGWRTLSQVRHEQEAADIHAAAVARANAGNRSRRI